MASPCILLLFFLCYHVDSATDLGKSAAAGGNPRPWEEAQGGQFATGSVDFGGLELREHSTFTKIWTADKLSSGNGSGVTFFSPVSLPFGFFPLGSHAQPTAATTPHLSLIARDTSRSSYPPSLSAPTGFTLLFSTAANSSSSSPTAFFWLPLPPPSYSPVGHLLTASPQKPPLSSLRCVRNDLLRRCQPGPEIWSPTEGAASFSVHRPNSLGPPAGTFVARGTFRHFACLKNNVMNQLAAMPNLTQLTALIQTFGPVFRFHPSEPFLPSSVSWFFNNGALLYSHNDMNNPVRIDPAGGNLPQGGSNDGAYWLDLPADDSAKQRVKAGELSSAEAYIHVKPMLGGTATDIVFWVFYPFNGPAKAKVEFINIALGRIGEHVGDWEHVTLRFSNFDGRLKKMYLSQHSKGAWVDAAELEYEAGTQQPVAYATLHGHAFYPRPGLVLLGEVEKGIGIRDETAAGGAAMDGSAVWSVVSAEYLGVAEPAWLQYMREWGPKVSYDVAKELEKVERFLPGKLKRELTNLVSGLPPELLGEEGPTGPKVKPSWNGDEA